MKLGSLFDGSGGFPLAGLLCGIEPVWASEIEKYPIAVTTKRLPSMKHLGDITKIDGAKVEPVDIISFGSPCQDLSLAGKRAGLSGSRSGLFAEAIRIIKEMRGATGGKYPRFIIWENVPGAFSSNKGEDFRIVLQEIAQIADVEVSIPRSEKWNGAGEIVADTFSIAYRTFDAQFWGVPQRRRRIYLIADFGSRCAGKILFEREGLSWNHAPSGKTWQEIADGLNRGALLPSVTLKIRGGAAGGGKGPLIQYEKSATLSCHNDQTLFSEASGFQWYKSASADICFGEEVVPLMEATMPNAVLCSGFSAGQGVKARGIGYKPEQSPTLKGANSGSNQVPVICYQQKDYTEFYESDLGATLMAKGGSYGGGSRNLVVLLNINGCRDRKGIDRNAELVSSTQIALHPEVTGTLYASGAGTNRVAGQGNESDLCICIAGNTIERKPQNGGNGTGVKVEVGYTLNTVDRHAVCLASGKNATGTLMANCATKQWLGNQEAFSGDYFVHCGYRVRRLTPLECCRLQGFPDWWCLDVEGSDSAQYKMWGNGVALPCVFYVMQGITMYA